MRTSWISLLLVAACLLEVCLSLNYTGPTCVTACSRRGRQQYQLCDTCNYFLNCWRGVGYRTACQNDHGGKKMVWDDTMKWCTYTGTSTTCLLVGGDGPLIPDKLTTGPACIEGCKGRPDGDYQSCKACDVYATCSNEIMYDERPCAYGKNNKQPVWDDEKKRCMWKTDTCSGPYPEGGAIPP